MRTGPRESSAVSCACGEPATTTLSATVGRITLELDLCETCALGEERDLVAQGMRPVNARVDYKPRALYVSASGVPFTGAQARAWLMERGLAKPKGRLSREHIEAYRASH